MKIFPEKPPSKIKWQHYSKGHHYFECLFIRGSLKYQTVVNLWSLLPAWLASKQKLIFSQSYLMPPLADP